jgi:hypothetical protein
VAIDELAGCWQFSGYLVGFGNHELASLFLYDFKCLLMLTVEVTRDD